MGLQKYMHASNMRPKNDSLFLLKVASIQGFRGVSATQRDTYHFVSLDLLQREKLALAKDYGNVVKTV